MNALAIGLENLRWPHTICLAPSNDPSQQPGPWKKPSCEYLATY
jgi:hypothetical protein